MSNYLSIGFVYSKKNNEKKLMNILEWFHKKQWKVEFLKFSEDVDGNSWNEVNKNITDLDISDALLRKFFGICNFSVSTVDDEKISFSLGYRELTKNDFGFLIQVKASQLYKVGNRERLRKIELGIISLLNEIYHISKYSYAFADDEADIEYTVEQVEDATNGKYSIVAIPENESSVDIRLSSWELDGLTPRD